MDDGHKVDVSEYNSNAPNEGWRSPSVASEVSTHITNGNITSSKSTRSVVEGAMAVIVRGLG